MKQITPHDPVILFSDKNTGKAYVVALDDLSARIVFGLIDCPATEIAPVIIRGVNVSEERARQIINEQQPTVAEGLAEVLKGGEPVAKRFEDMPNEQRTVEKASRLAETARTGVAAFAGMASTQRQWMGPSIHNLPKHTVTGNALGQTVAQGINARLPASLVDAMENPPVWEQSHDNTGDLIQCLHCRRYQMRYHVQANDGHCRFCTNELCLDEPPYARYAKD